MSKYVHHSEWFYGNKIGAYALEHGYIDYATLAKAFDAILNNNIIAKTCAGSYWEVVNGEEVTYYRTEDDEQITEEEAQEVESYEVYADVYQYYIVSDRGAEILQELTNELVWYNEELDLYVWGVCHWGTSWGYVLTDIKIDPAVCKAAKRDK